MATVDVTKKVPVEGFYSAHRHACERCHGLYMKAAGGKCGQTEHAAPNQNGMIFYGYCDAVCYRGDRPLHSREGQLVAEGRES